MANAYTKPAKILLIQLIIPTIASSILRIWLKMPTETAVPVCHTRKTLFFLHGRRS